MFIVEPHHSTPPVMDAAVWPKKVPAVAEFYIGSKFDSETLFPFAGLALAGHDVGSSFFPALEIHVLHFRGDDLDIHVRQPPSFVVCFFCWSH